MAAPNEQSEAEQLEPIRYTMWCTATHKHDLLEQERGNLVLYADYDDLRSKYLALQSATPEVESAKIADLKRQLAAEREHGKLLQGQVDAFLRPATQQSELDDPFCWYIVKRDITDEYVTVFSEAENCPGPEWKPLYTAPLSETQAGGTAKALKAAIDDRVLDLALEAGRGLMLDTRRHWGDDERGLLRGMIFTAIDAAMRQSGNSREGG